jgi:radical SAM-linked protein
MVPTPEPRARWRLVVGRSAMAAAAGTGRDAEVAWSDAITQSGLPAVLGDGGRPRVSFGAPLPAGMLADGELVDIVLTERLPRWHVREAIEREIPEGWTLHDLADVWLGAPSLTAAVAAADYVIVLDGVGDLEELTAGIRAITAAPTLLRQRIKGSGTVGYDLRPLIVDLAVVPDAPTATIRARLRIHPTLGNGRPEEAVAAIGDQLGRPVAIHDIIRERLLVADALT